MSQPRPGEQLPTQPLHLVPSAPGQLSPRGTRSFLDSIKRYNTDPRQQGQSYPTITILHISFLKEIAESSLTEVPTSQKPFLSAQDVAVTARTYLKDSK